MGTKRPRNSYLKKAETINVGVIVEDGASKLEKKIIILEEKVNDMGRHIANMDLKLNMLIDLVNSLKGSIVDDIIEKLISNNQSSIPKANSKEEPESREKSVATAKKFRDNFEFEASMSGMGGIGRKKSQEVHIVLSDSSSYASSNAASEEVSSKLLSSENDTKSPLKSHAKGVEENFSLEQKNVLKYMFDINLSHNETIVRMSGEFGQRMQFKQLQTSQWLSAEIINLYACMLTWDKRNNASKIPVENWFLPTYVSQFITAMKKGCDVGCIYRYFLREDKYGGDIQKCEKIFIPMNPGDHWYLCVVDIIQEEVLILDSLMSKNCNERISSAKVVLKCLHEALEIGCGATYSINIPLFPTRMAQWAPQQKNLYDCGLFTIRFMQLYDKLRAGMHLSIDNSYLERRKIAIEIFYHQANETKEEILRKIVYSSEAACPAATP